jgi:hypothetical protein
MRSTLVAALALAGSLLVPPQAAVAAGNVSLNLVVVGGGGVLADDSRVSVNAILLTLDTPGKDVNISNGGLVVDGVRTKCAIESSTNCSQATLSCADGSSHEVVAGVPGGAPGSVDGIDLAEGFITMKCVSR